MGGFLTEILPGLVILLVVLVQLEIIVKIVQHHFHILLHRIEEIDAQQKALLRPRIQG